MTKIILEKKKIAAIITVLKNSPGVSQKQQPCVLCHMCSCVWQYSHCGSSLQNYTEWRELWREKKTSELIGDKVVFDFLLSFESQDLLFSASLTAFIDNINFNKENCIQCCIKIREQSELFFKSKIQEQPSCCLIFLPLAFDFSMQVRVTAFVN